MRPSNDQIQQSDSATRLSFAERQVESAAEEIESVPSSLVVRPGQGDRLSFILLLSREYVRNWPEFTPLIRAKWAPFFRVCCYFSLKCQLHEKAVKCRGGVSGIFRGLILSLFSIILNQHIKAASNEMCFPFAENRCQPRWPYHL